MKVKLCFWFIYLWCRSIALLPDRFVYTVLTGALHFTLHRILRYRRSVVRTNLRNAFPERSDRELKRIERGFYGHLSEVIFDTVMLSGMGPKKARRRIVYPNLDQAMQAIGGRSWIAALAHYGSWEFFSAFQLFTSKQVVGVYRPLHSAVFDMYYNKVRSRFGLSPVAMDDVMRFVVRNRNGERGFVLGLIADQTPPWGTIDHWYRFLNQPTAFFPGIEKTARKFALPVIFVHTRKLGKARYEVTLEVIYDGAEPLADDHEITERYIRRLEAMISETPELWMWSHRRWKHQPSPETPL
ncbi:MAG: lysophospholipid acyltransferase family protein [Rikenellaceae bacterium]|jgi:KDO2-lipid IV(A) lauroyltransferase|nr:lysophospholipid acyltransferase family protein [Rikenellaceae bacterium]